METVISLLKQAQPKRSANCTSLYFCPPQEDICTLVVTGTEKDTEKALKMAPENVYFSKVGK
jgi:hypothetical protein